MSSAAGEPPRSNGELLFDQPWQSRAFGLAAAAEEAGHFTWSQFQKYLIAEIANPDAPDTGEPAGYYECWLDALARLLADDGTTSRAEVVALAEQYAAREPGHDHHH